MRLIDAEHFINRFVSLCETDTDIVIAKKVCDTLIDEPTAYDVGKIVEELEKLKDKGSVTKTEMLITKSCIDKAIEIVKHGGVSDDVCEWKMDNVGASIGCRSDLHHTGYVNRTYCPYCGKKIKVVEQMDRLTRKDKCKSSHGEDIVICKHDKQDCNDSCMKIYPCKWYKKVQDKLWEYENLEEQGLLLRLPCGTGADVYIIPSKVNYELNLLGHHAENNRVYHQNVNNITFTSRGWYMECDKDIEYGTGGILVDKFYKETWFLSREEAVQKLKEMEGESE